MKKVIVLALLLFTNNIYGQSLLEDQKPQPPQIIPSSPQSKIYEKYINHEVTEYNGLPVIEIPLYEIEIKGLKIPITLSYHAGGIKYMEYNGDIAAGWSINVGGYRISRTIMGKPDEDFPIYKETDYHKYKGNKTRDGIGYLGSIAHGVGTADNFMHSLIGDRTYYDGEYDHFSYTIPGSNGQFIIADRDDNSKRRIANTNLQDKVVLANTTKLSLNDISIVDANGFIYYMGKRPSSSDILTESVSTIGYKTGWPLRQIRSPFNETIDFQYIKYNISHDRGLLLEDYHTYCIRETYPREYIGEDILDTNHYYTESSYDDTFVNSYNPNYETCFISEIRTENEIVEFVRDYGEYSHTEPPYILKEIIIKTKGGDEKRRISFDYLSDLHRLLNRLKIGDEVYNFAYYDTLTKNEQHLYSDVWGYYKEAESGQSWLNYLDERYKDDVIAIRNHFNGNINKTFKYFIENNRSEVEWVDRESNGETTHTFSLKTITFPTGGTTEYIYEPNQYKLTKGIENFIITGGGQRIKKIISKASKDAKSFTTVFKYGKGEIGYGELRNPLSDVIRHDFVNEYVTRIYDADVNETAPGLAYTPWCQTIVTKNYSSRRAFNSDQYSNAPVTYTQVTKYQYNEENNEFNGKTISYYETSYLPSNQISPVYYESIPDIHLNHNVWNCMSAYFLGQKAKLDRVEIYNRDNSIKQTEVYAYKANMNDMVKFNSVKVKQIVTVIDRNELSFLHPESLFIDFYVQKMYTTFLVSYLLSQKTTTLYTENGETTTIEKRDYNSKDQPSKITHSGSTTSDLVKAYKYPQDFVSESNIYQQMVDKNMISPVIEQTLNKNNRVINKIKNSYFTDAQKTKNIIQPEKTETTTSENQTLRTEIFYDQYDSRGNLLQYTGKDGMPVSYIWSYNYQYPIAEFKNMSYNEAKTKMNTYLGVDITTQKSLSTTIENKIKIFPTSTNVPQGTLVTTYTYKPLVGMTSATDPSGRTVSYNYDAFGRLQSIKDHEGNIVEEYTYNYRNK